VVFSGNGVFNSGNVFTVQLSNGSGSFASPVNIGTLTATAPAAITATIPSGTGSGSGYRIRVVSSNPALIGTDNGTAIPITALPGAAGSITGSVTVCQTQTGVVYTVPVIANAAFYQWTLPSGASFATTTYTNSISVNYSASAIAGNVTVAGRNACGTGTASNLAVTVGAVAPAAGAITGPATLCGGTSGVIYSISPLSGVTGYSWTVPSGASIVSGSNTNSVTVDFGSATSTGSITVAGVNGCGAGASSSLAVSVLPPPAVPTVSAAGSTSLCPSGSVALSFSANTGYDYQWRRNGTDISGATAANYTATQTGTYDVRASFSAVPAQSITNSTAATINDNTCTATGISNIVVSGYGAPIPSSGIAVTINITHTYDGDIAIFLQAPNGEVLGLSNQQGGSGANFTNTVFTDTASQVLPASGAPYTGYYRPVASTFTNCISSSVTSFGQFGGGAINPNGTWSLRVYDRAGGDVGTINSWTLQLPAQTNSCTSLSNPITVTPANAVAVSGFTPSSGSTGTLVTINGSGFTGATSVKFNGVSASFTVVSDNVVTATVPLGATSGSLSVTAPCGIATSGASFTIGAGVSLNVRLLIEGYHLGAGTMPEVSAAGVCDTVTIVLATAANSAVDAATSRSTISTSGWGTFSFPGLTPGSYFIGIRHRNSVETWSATAQSLVTGSNTYDFTTSASQAFGGNLRNLGSGRFGLFSGDVNQDGLIESADYSQVENAVLLFAFGYLTEDLSGDGLVESSDYSLVENNLLGFIFSIRP
jgi:subtilisin-like proprotein convertase family protein